MKAHKKGTRTVRKLEAQEAFQTVALQCKLIPEARSLPLDAYDSVFT